MFSDAPNSQIKQLAVFERYLQIFCSFFGLFGVNCAIWYFENNSHVQEFQELLQFGILVKLYFTIQCQSSSYRNSVSTWSSGTGFAGLFGALSYAGLTAVGVSPSTTLFIMLAIPGIMAITYVCLTICLHMFVCIWLSASVFLSVWLCLPVHTSMLCCAHLVQSVCL